MLTPTITLPTSTTVPLTPTLTPIPKGKTIVVTSADDDGPGTLRQAMSDAQPGDIITFDPNVFPPKNPKAIELKSGLPSITQGYLTLDASNAGVILDGSQVGGDWTSGIEINSEHNVTRGLQSIHFTGPGIRIGIDDTAQFNVIGGDRKVGVGPLGQGNLFSDDSEGVAIWGSDNIVTGNLIGTDVTGRKKLGNRGSGIYVVENASRNAIGPNNIIAYNGTVGATNGVEIHGRDAQANIITANSIYDNSFAGIQTVTPTAPLILDFDIASGMVEGIACPDCVVEVFSTHAYDGEVYEGSVTADQYGNFSFSKGQALAGPFITVTSRSTDSNTSKFSLPASRVKGTLTLQDQDDAPRSLLVAKPSDQLADNRVGAVAAWSTDCEEQYLYDQIFALGAKHFKVSLSEVAPQANLGGTNVTLDWNTSEFTISPEQEKCITALLNSGLTLTYILNFWDKANHPQGWQPNISRFRTQEEIDRYLEYVRFVVQHFKGRIQYYEMWNEPDNYGVPLQWIQSNEYINLVRQTIPVIRQEDSNAKIVVGGVMAFHNISSQAYLFTLLKSDIMPLVNVVSWHAMSGDSPEYYNKYYYGYPALVQSIKDEALAHGFKGEYWADELIWRDPDCVWCDPGNPLYSNVVAAKYLVRGIVTQLGLDLNTQVTGNSTLRRVSFFATGNLNTVMAGNKPINLPITIQSEATLARNYSFSLPNGDKLVAVWNDGKAVNDDPGASSTITIPGFAGWKATGIDVLNGFEQGLVTSDENGNLIISGFMLKDYPIIIRLSK